ncbi:MAG: hypothetical protein VW405_12775 [Rhodospirillaceae bacterium]
MWLPLDDADGVTRHAIAAFGIGYAFQPGEQARAGGPAEWAEITYPEAGKI